MANPYELVFCALYLWGLEQHGEEDGPQYNAVLAMSATMVINLTCVIHILESNEIISISVSAIPKPVFAIAFVIVGILHYAWILSGGRYRKIAAKVQSDEALRRRARTVAVLYHVGSLSLLFGAWSV